MQIKNRRYWKATCNSKNRSSKAISKKEEELKRKNEKNAVSYLMKVKKYSF